MANKKSEIHGTIDINLENNGLDASLSFHPSAEKSEFDITDFQRFLQERSVKEGFSAQNLEKVLKQLEKAREALTVPVAKGTPPEQPEPERVTWK